MQQHGAHHKHDENQATMSLNSHRAQVHLTVRQLCLHTPVILQPCSAWKCSLSAQQRHHCLTWSKTLPCCSTSGKRKGTQQHLQQTPNCYSSLGGFTRDLCITWNWWRQKLCHGNTKQAQKVSLKIPEEQDCCVSTEDQVVKETPALHGLRLVSWQAVGSYPLLVLAAQYSPLGIFRTLFFQEHLHHPSHRETCNVGNTASGDSLISGCWGISLPQYLVGHQQKYRSAS